jgi:hypothetical protein
MRIGCQSDGYRAPARLLVSLGDRLPQLDSSPNLALDAADSCVKSVFDSHQQLGSSTLVCGESTCWPPSSGRLNEAGHVAGHAFAGWCSRRLAPPLGPGPDAWISRPGGAAHFGWSGEPLRSFSGLGVDGCFACVGEECLGLPVRLAVHLPEMPFLSPL